MMSTRPVRACAASGKVAYRVAGQDVPAGPKIQVELSLDGVQQLRDVLVFVDQDGLVRFGEPGRIGSHRRSGGQVIAVDHRSSQAPGQLAEQGALAHGARSVEDHHWLFSKPCFHDLPEPPARQAGQYSAHVPTLPFSSAIPLIIFRVSRQKFPRLPQLAVVIACMSSGSLR